MSSPPATTQPQPPPPGRRRRELLGPTALIVMVVAILAFTAVAITMELAANRGKAFKATVTVVGPVAGRPDKCEAVLFNLRGDRVGVGAVSLHDPIQPGASQDEPAIGTAAEPPINGAVTCRALEPG